MIRRLAIVSVFTSPTLCALLVMGCASQGANDGVSHAQLESRPQQAAESPVLEDEALSLDAVVAQPEGLVEPVEPVEPAPEGLVEPEEPADAPAEPSLAPMPEAEPPPAVNERRPAAKAEEKPAADVAASREAPRRQGRRARKKSARASGIGYGAGGIAHAPRMAPGAPADFDAPRFNTEAYDAVPEHDFVAVADDPRSTFSIDVDTASYSNVRRFLRDGQLPPPDAVRIEELVNYFDYDYAAPRGGEPFSVQAEVSDCPWNEDHRLVHIGIAGQEIHQAQVPARNLVFLLDVSGSMNSPDKLPLLKRAMALLVDHLRPQDKVSIVVYAGASGVVLPPTTGSEKGTIMAALDQLSAGGSTNGGAGIHAAYAMARKAFIRGGINRVILATDGDFNIGTTSQGDLVRLIEQKRDSGVFLSVLGLGRGNLKDSNMEKLADKGNGNYAYIDSLAEARKVLVEQAGATLVTIAKDVKLQVEFNPAKVERFRLIGYENRKLAHADFNDDRKDAGEIGAGHTVTALYEVVPADGEGAKGAVDPLRYQEKGPLSEAARSDELMTVKIRYKRPNGSRSHLLTAPVVDADVPLARSSRDFRFAAAVAGFGMLLRGSRHQGGATYASMRSLAAAALGSDPNGRRAEFVTLIDRAAALAGRSTQR